MNELPIDKELTGTSEYDYATTGQRFANFLIDIVIINIVNALLMEVYGEYIVGWLLQDASSLQDLPAIELKVSLISLLHNYITIVLFFTISEHFMRGKTIGKIITGTRAVRDDYTSITFKDALLRSLCRIIPFEPFSFLGGSNGWHDTMTGTTVIRDK